MPEMSENARYAGLAFNSRAGQHLCQRFLVSSISEHPFVADAVSCCLPSTRQLVDPTNIQKEWQILLSSKIPFSPAQTDFIINRPVAIFMRVWGGVVVVVVLVVCWVFEALRTKLRPLPLPTFLHLHQYRHCIRTRFLRRSFIISNHNLPDLSPWTSVQITTTTVIASILPCRCRGGGDTALSGLETCHEQTDPVYSSNSEPPNPDEYWSDFRHHQPDILKPAGHQAVEGAIWSVSSCCCQ